MIKTRFAPSPTGHLHLGNARIALFNFLFAKTAINQGQDGEFILRIEDTDQNRSQNQYIQNIFDDLTWLAIQFDTKKVIYQSQRNAIYQRYLNQLINKNLAYPCFCSKERLRQSKQEQIKQKKAFKYDGKCSNLSEEEIQNLIDGGIKPAYRFRLTKKEVYLNDLRHQKKQNLSNYGDFVIQKSNGEFIFLLTNIVDDIEQSITHSIRGEDHLSNSVLQTAICEGLGKKTPVYLHLSLIANQLGKPLSKRDGVFSIQDLKKQSYHSIAIINYLARLGNPINLANILSIEEIVTHFDLSTLAKSSAKFDINQLNFWQKKTIASLSLEQLKKWLNSSVTLNGQGIDDRNLRSNILRIIQDNLVFADDFLNLSKIFTEEAIGKNSKFNENFKEDISNIPNAFIETIIHAIEQHWDYQELINQLKGITNLSGRELFIPLRIIISAQNHGPQLQDIYNNMDRQLMINRAKYCLELKNKI